MPHDHPSVTRCATPGTNLSSNMTSCHDMFSPIHPFTHSPRGTGPRCGTNDPGDRKSGGSISVRWPWRHEPRRRSRRCRSPRPHHDTLEMTTDTAVAAQAVHRLAAAGHRRIAFLGGHPRSISAQQRYRGYCDALQELGILLTEELVVHDVGQITLAERTATALLLRPTAPTALFTAQHLTTLGAMQALRRLGLERRVALLGFDDVRAADPLSLGPIITPRNAGEIPTPRH
jgi:Periplasmic binding protein-like domain